MYSGRQTQDEQGAVGLPVPNLESAPQEGLPDNTAGKHAPPETATSDF